MKWLLLSLVVLAYYFTPMYNILNKGINYLKYTSFFADSFYGDIEVGNEEVMVRDFYINGNCLYIFPLNNEVILPIDVSISKINNDSIVVIDNQFNYEITHFESEVKLYAYIKSNDSLGYCEDYYVIYSDNINYIAKRLTIYYEKI